MFLLAADCGMLDKWCQWIACFPKSVCVRFSFCYFRRIVSRFSVFPSLLLLLRCAPFVRFCFLVRYRRTIKCLFVRTTGAYAWRHTRTHTHTPPSICPFYIAPRTKHAILHMFAETDFYLNRHTHTSFYGTWMS